MRESKTITRAALVVSGGILLSRIIGYLRTAFIGAELSIGSDTDLYVAAFTIPDYLFFLMAGGYLSITLVPILASRLADGGPEHARHAFTAVFRFVLVLMLVATAIGVALAGPITELLFPRYTPAQVDRLVPMMRITFVSQIFFVAGTLYMAAQYASRRFLIPTMAPIIYNVAIIGGGLIGAARGETTPEAFIWGGLAGAIIGNFALQVWGARTCGIWLVRGGERRHPAVREYLTLAIPLMIGQSAVALDEQWPRVFGQFAGEGAQAGLVFARQLNMVPVGVIAQAAGVAAFPFLAGLAAEGKLGELATTVRRSVRGALAIGALAGGLVVALSDPIVRIAYQYGQFRRRRFGVRCVVAVLLRVLYPVLGGPPGVHPQLLRNAEDVDAGVGRNGHHRDRRSAVVVFGRPERSARRCRGFVGDHRDLHGDDRHLVARASIARRRPRHGLVRAQGGRGCGGFRTCGDCGPNGC